MNELAFPESTELKNLKRIIGSYPAKEHEGPLVIGIGGLHGNEPSGVLAMENIFEKLNEKDLPVNGKFVGLAGNLPALNKNHRFIDEDLNRIFTEQRIKSLETKARLSVEEREMEYILTAMDEMTQHHDEVYFIDCHTTSSPTIPYISVNEYPKSLELARRYPLFNVIGLEKSIPGCLAEFFNQKGYSGFTIEAGKHHTLTSIENTEASIWLFLVYTGLIEREDLPFYDEHYEMLKERVTERNEDFKVVEHYKIGREEDFEMEPGYVNFQKVSKGEILATNQSETIRSSHKGRILMPLYQSQGDDGYFILKKAA